VEAVSGENYVVASISTADTPECEVCTLWNYHVDTLVFPTSRRYSDLESFSGEMMYQQTPQYRLTKWIQKGEIDTFRTAAHVRADAHEDSYRLMMPVGGRFVTDDGERQHEVTPGTATLISLTGVFRARNIDSAGLILQIPRAEMDRRWKISTPLAMGIDLATGLGAVIRGMAADLFTQRDRLSGHEFDAICDRLCELLAMLAVKDDRPTYLTEVEHEIRRYIRQHAADPEMTGASVAEGLGWSLRQVQLVLQRGGTTPRELIREERLHLVQDLLRSRAHQHHPIADLAHLAGFASARALSAAYRARFGTLLRDVRDQARTEAETEASP